MPYYTMPAITLLDYMMQNLEKQAKGKRQQKVAEEIKEEYNKLLAYTKELTDDVNRGEFDKRQSQEESEESLYPEPEVWGLYNGMD